MIRLRRLRLPRRLRVPETTVRLRLTLLYGALFLACGAGLLAITYTLVDHAGLQPVNQFVGAAPGTGAQGSITPPPGATFKRGATTTSRIDPSRSQVTVPPGSKLRGLSLPPTVQRLLRSSAGRSVVRVVVSDQRIADQHQLIIESGVALAIMALISTGLGWLVAGRALAPLRVMTSATREISAVNLHKRLDMTGPRDELRQLADTIDGLLARLEASFVAQRRFVMNASHELRTPLTAVRALLEMVLADPDATVETYRDVCREVLEENHQQEELIDALLILARGQRGITHPEPVDLALVTRDSVALQRAAIADSGLTVETAIEPAAVSGDRRLIERLVSNLIENAVLHNVPDGRIDVRVRTASDTVELTVANTGEPIPPGEIERLLEPFQRLGPERTGPREGLGLGLSIVAAIAQAHDASLHVQAAEGGGLSVAVRFPAAVAFERLNVLSAPERGTHAASVGGASESKELPAMNE